MRVFSQDKTVVQEVVEVGRVVVFEQLFSL